MGDATFVIKSVEHLKTLKHEKRNLQVADGPERDPKKVGLKIDVKGGDEVDWELWHLIPLKGGEKFTIKNADRRSGKYIVARPDNTVEYLPKESGEKTTKGEAWVLEPLGTDLYKIVNNDRYLKSFPDGSVKLSLRRDDSETVWQIINKSGAALDVGSSTLQPAGTTDFEELLQRVLRLRDDLHERLSPEELKKYLADEEKRLATALKGH